MPPQAVVPYEDAEGQYIHNSIQSPEIALMGEGTGVEFAWDVYADLPINSLVFYTIGYTSVIDGCPEPWFRAFSYIYSTTPWWARAGTAMGANVAPGATGVQLELRVRDMCPYWCGYYGNGECHTNAPLFDIELIPIAGGDPYVLYDLATHIALDPTGRFLAATNLEGKLHLWPVPEGQPTHTLPRDELMDYLRSQTTARAVPDTSSATGFGIVYEPFAGWDAVPQK